MTVPTGKIVVAIVIGLFLVEMATIVDSAPGNTISEVVWHVIAGRPFVPFLAGFLCGHFFWQKT